MSVSPALPAILTMSLAACAVAIGIVASCAGPGAPSRAPAVPAPQWTSTITLPSLYGAPASYRGLFVTETQCQEAVRAAIGLMATHEGGGTVSPCAKE